MGQAVLVSELLRADGPHAGVADDFVTDRCSHCGEWDLEDMRFSHAGGFLCPRCLAAQHVV